MNKAYLYTLQPIFNLMWYWIYNVFLIDKLRIYDDARWLSEMYYLFFLSYVRQRSADLYFEKQLLFRTEVSTSTSAGLTPLSEYH